MQSSEKPGGSQEFCRHCTVTDRPHIGYNKFANSNMNPECTHYEYNRMTSIQRLSAYITCQSQHHHLSLIVFHSIENSRPLAKSRRSQQSASVIGLRSPSSNAVFMMGTSLMSRTALTLLILHALLNIAQGVYCITHPAAWLELAPDAFQGSPNAAVQAIGTSPNPVLHRVCSTVLLHYARPTYSFDVLTDDVLTHARRSRRPGHWMVPACLCVAG